MAGTICTDVEPTPTTATRLPVTSTVSGRHCDVWNLTPLKSDRPGQAGGVASFRNPAPATTIEYVYSSSAVQTRHTGGHSSQCTESTVVCSRMCLASPKP